CTILGPYCTSSGCYDNYFDYW
nr:immunoglobulin heavy chain junction region [Macaca mulatta]MOV54097.1 immunoglobulin heavy chain junction region [Macaca mulatta]MOV54985.1 immunoglobulin heavy chain junction region [Macaca mulatta]MOV58203.1 immunoglobulin heavy chain junction region [Macaca mulatta]MOV59529.1 immunoglobulin heavy chain junction region [Macaca mulatta]